MSSLISQNPNVNNRVQALLRIKDTALAMVPITPEQRLVVNDPVYYSLGTVVGTAVGDATVIAVADDPKRQFYITGWSIGILGQAGAGQGSGELRATYQGVTRTIAKIFVLPTATATDSANQAVSLNYPLPVDRGTNITCVFDTTEDQHIAVYGFYEGV